jgi:hypothetical protein
MKTVINIIYRYFKQLKCKHDWRIKGSGTMDTQWFSSTEKRCCKCKKVEYKSFNKII